MKTPLEMFYHWEKTSPDALYLRQPIDGVWHNFSWKRASDETRRVATALQNLKLPPGSHIALASKNCAHWIMADLAIWMSGHVSVPLYPNLSAQTIRTILEHSGCKAIFLGKLDNWDPYLEGLTPGISVITFPYGGPGHYPTWNNILAKESPMKESPARRLDEIATIIYTSGTTGVPKGVVHKFKSFAFSATNVKEVVACSPSDRLFSYLPLAHVAERVLTETVGLYAGVSISFAESLDLFAKNLQDTRPTIFLGVPRIWEKFRAGILLKLPEAKLNRLLKIPLLSSLIRKKIKRGLGIIDARICLSGAAPIPVSLIQWFQKLGVTIQEAYGLTENFAYSHFNRPGRVKIGTVGEPWPGVEVRLGEGNEILVKSETLMEGYYKAPELTSEVIRNGYLHTGDQGALDAEGFLRITGRVKELFKTAKGKYVAPSPIELKLAASAYLDQVCVLGSGMSAPLGLVTLSESGKKLESNELTSALDEHLKKINSTLDPHERLSKLVVLKDSWTVENEFLTPSMKLKRHKVESYYGEKLSSWGEISELIIMT
jgi:long-chain acyl-CoA synthetase